MNFKRVYLHLILSPFIAFSAHAGDLQEDLHWYKVALSFSSVATEQADAFLNPFNGAQSFRLSESKAPWAGNYFPMVNGGIAQRWSEGSHPTQTLDEARLAALTETQRQKLSPVEKYDILMSDYGFSSTNHELNTRGPLRPGGRIQDWEGFCNGVRCAGIMLPEPKYAVERMNAQGIKVRFEPADLKALAGASYFYTQDYAQIGGPTTSRRAQNQPNAAIFDLVLRYGLAKNKKAFIIDSHLGKEIWNETVVGYERTLSELKNLTPTEKMSFPQATAKVEIQLVLETLGEVDIKESNRPTKSRVADGSLLQTLNAAYTLYLDSTGNAIDGKWKRTRESRGVDFAWFVGGKGADRDYAFKGGNPYMSFDVIKKLFSEASRPVCRNIFL